MLVGLKIDLRGDILLEKELQLCHQKMVTKEHGKATAKALSTERYMVPYVECSAVHGQNLHEVMDEVGCPPVLILLVLDVCQLMKLIELQYL